jgi:hypothetical protein
MSLKKEPGDRIGRMGEHAFEGRILERIARAREPISLRAQPCASRRRSRSLKTRVARTTAQDLSSKFSFPPSRADSAVHLNAWTDLFDGVHEPQSQRSIDAARWLAMADAEALMRDHGAEAYIALANGASGPRADPWRRVLVHALRMQQSAGSWRQRKRKKARSCSIRGQNGTLKFI